MYHYAGNNPVKYTDPDGESIFVVGALIVWGANCCLFGYGIGAMRSDEIGFAFRHPIIANQIGTCKTGIGCTNISTNSARFSNAVGNDDLSPGGTVNAIRHCLWSSTIASDFGADIAKEVTNSHDSKNLDGYLFTNQLDADTRCDQLNNCIGITLGSTSNCKSMKELTGKVLETFKNEGLWCSSKDTNGNWIVSKRKMTNEEYEKAIIELNRCNAKGFRLGDKNYVE